jgi:hypothetical protein
MGFLADSQRLVGASMTSRCGRNPRAADSLLPLDIAVAPISGHVFRQQPATRLHPRRAQARLSTTTMFRLGILESTVCFLSSPLPSPPFPSPPINQTPPRRMPSLRASSSSLSFAQHCIQLIGRSVSVQLVLLSCLYLVFPSGFLVSLLVARFHLLSTSLSIV